MSIVMSLPSMMTYTSILGSSADTSIIHSVALPMAKMVTKTSLSFDVPLTMFPILLTFEVTIHTLTIVLPFVITTPNDV